ncbi:MAG: helicase C-terminal domain-containing protein [Nanoarchaeota archaeon]
MGRLQFDSFGKFIGADQKVALEYDERNNDLRTSGSLEFLKEEKKFENIFDREYWNLNEDGKSLPPLKFSNGKTQEDVIREIVSLIKQGRKVIFLHGICGTGKSAIALNIARVLGRASIVVPVKALQKQYEEDYMSKKYVLKANGTKLKIAIISGRENHDSVIFPGRSCADPFLPDTINITDKNVERIRKFYKDNPFISNEAMPLIKHIRRISIAPANPYWSPILPAVYELNHLRDAKKRRYKGLYGKEFIFYHRKEGCSYYDQYIAYLEADVIIFNSAKYLAETAIGRKPQTDVDIIDEADEFLDSFSNNVEINLTRLAYALQRIALENEDTEGSVKKIIELINLEEANKKALGVDENQIFSLLETKISKVLQIFLRDLELATEIELDELNYANKALEAAKSFQDDFSETFLTYRKEDEQLHARLVTTNLAKRFKEIVEGNKSLVLMSGTLHSEEVLKHIFGIEDFVRVEAETLNQGSLDIVRTGKEFDCKYSNFESSRYTREDYLKALNESVSRAKKPTLIHVNAYIDLPDDKEIFSLALMSLMTREELLRQQQDDKTGKLIAEFKQGKFDKLFTTKCSRGVDFPGETCNSVIFTKYPNSNVQDTFWKILQRTHRDYYWEFYKDKAKREFLQRLYRAIRSKDDHVFVLSPDIRVLDAVRSIQSNF